jgi:hypothetical protein
MPCMRNGLSISAIDSYKVLKAYIFPIWHLKTNAGYLNYRIILPYFNTLLILTITNGKQNTS